jgi:hypothetical protein
MFITFLVTLGAFLLLAVRKTLRVQTRDCFRRLARPRTFCNHAHPVSRNFHTRGSTRLQRCHPLRSDWNSAAAQCPTERRGKGCRIVSLIDTRSVTGSRRAGSHRLHRTASSARDIEMLCRTTINSDGCGVFGTYWGRIVSGCRGLQPSELFSPAFSAGTDPTRSVSGVRGKGHKLTIASVEPTIHAQSGFRGPEFTSLRCSDQPVCISATVAFNLFIFISRSARYHRLPSTLGR